MYIRCIIKDNEGNEKTLYVSHADMSNDEMEFSYDKYDAWEDTDYWVELTYDWFRHHFLDKYPQLQNSQVV